MQLFGKSGLEKGEKSIKGTLSDGMVSGNSLEFSAQTYRAGHGAATKRGGGGNREECHSSGESLIFWRAEGGNKKWREGECPRVASCMGGKTGGCCEQLKKREQTKRG